MWSSPVWVLESVRTMHARFGSRARTCIGSPRNFSHKTLCPPDLAHFLATAPILSHRSLASTLLRGLIHPRSRRGTKRDSPANQPESERGGPLPEGTGVSLTNAPVVRRCCCQPV